MSKPAQIAKSTFLVAVFITGAALVLTKSVWAATAPLHSCETSSSCVVGEFLYDDTYTPITTASCNFTSRYPDGSLFLNSVPMTAAADGWYSYEFTSPQTLGIYRSQICCTAGSDYLCLDKSFNVSAPPLSQANVTSAVWDAQRSSYTTSGSFGEAIQNIIPASTDIAQATWSYSNRTLSAFGTLVADIWSYSSRSLTSLGTLAADVWNNGTRTLTGAGLSSGSLATKSDLDSQTTELKDEIKKNTTDVSQIKATTGETRILLEQLVNKPIIQNFIEEEILPLESKINDSKTAANKLFIHNQYIASKTGLLQVNWDSLTLEEIAEGISEFPQELGEEDDSSATDSVFGQLAFLKEAWGWPVIEAMFSQAVQIKQALVPLENVASAGQLKIAYNNLQNFSDEVAKLERQIGDIFNPAEEQTLFGKIKEVKELADTLDRQTSATESLLASWDSFAFPDQQKKVNQLSQNVSAINKIPKINKILLVSTLDGTVSEKELKNKLYSIIGLITANKQLLAKKAGQPLSTTWLELGSIVFKSLISNPSNLISQKTPVKYYLPPEVKDTDIIEKSEGLTIEYDTEKGQYYVSGEFTLAAAETKTVLVKVQDIWMINPQEVESLRKQAEELSRPLEKTSFFAQGVTLKSDINVSLDKILNLQKTNTNPENKIRAYREAQIELNQVTAKMEGLKSLVVQAGSVGTLFGFVGGSQTLAVWGLIIILVAGFVFLALYMKTLNSHEVVPAVEVPRKVNKGKTKFPIILLLVGMGLGLTAGLTINRIKPAQREDKKIENNRQVLGDKENVVASAAAKATDEESSQKAIEKREEQLIKIFVPLGTGVNVRSSPSLKSSVLTKIKKTSEFVQLDEKDGWVKIAIDIEKEGEVYREGWVNEEFTKEPDASLM